ncbi:T-protein [Fundidesulfovibrio magnetotacticus]|uniref:T-protein n=1 Tax=Fundidesulfovibrio magnetotacticus TaxID=2730080 RepID=A0A6V8LQG9_9BACT|nr:prephenate dehydrogenase/arogenate dehydrogenase family protein [Fundidesulfovibrio magnetotacticus]GFK93974.1 T-protein [Fundidesulfovibrio magnetotacticus]
MSKPSAIATLAVVGASGKMGRLFTARCRREGLACFELDAPLDMDQAARALPRADLVLLCVPAQAVTEALRALAPLIPKGCAVADICSVKVRPLEEMLALHPGPVVGTHPLFGPVPPEGEAPRVAVCPGRGEAACLQVEELLARLGFAPFRTTAHEHDRAMAYVQGLNFVSTVAYLAAQSAHEGFERFLTPSFTRRLEASRKLILEDAELFRLIFEANPHSLEAVRSFRNYLNVAAGGDLELLVERARSWWRQPAPAPTCNRDDEPAPKHGMPKGLAPSAAEGFSRDSAPAPDRAAGETPPAPTRSNKDDTP